MVESEVTKMTRSELAKAIKNAMMECGINHKGMYSAKELDEIAKVAKCNTFYVMMYLRYGKIL